MGEEASRISAVIFDLDGTILDTQRHVPLVLKEFLWKSFGKVMDVERELKRVGQVHKVSAAGIVADYDLPLTPDEYSEAIFQIYKNKWSEVKALPGANRLIRHLHKQGIPFAIASNSMRRNIETKISYQKGWKELFPVIIGVDDVKEGKPSPDMFLEAARKLDVEASQCLVLEDSLVGVKAAIAAGMKVVAVPSVITKIKDYYSLANCVIHSILEFKPELWGLPSFDYSNDQDTTEIEPFKIKGEVREEFSDLDSKQALEISLDDSSLELLQDQLFGFFFGWCKTDGFGAFHKVVLSMGWDLSTPVPQRKIKACLVGEDHEYRLHKSTAEPLEMLMVGYIKNSYPMEVEEPLEIPEDAKSNAVKALDLPKFAMRLME